MSLISFLSDWRAFMLHSARSSSSLRNSFTLSSRAAHVSRQQTLALIAPRKSADAKKDWVRPKATSYYFNAVIYASLRCREFAQYSNGKHVKQTPCSCWDWWTFRLNLIALKVYYSLRDELYKAIEYGVMSKKPFACFTQLLTDPYCRCLHTVCVCLGRWIITRWWGGDHHV